MNNLSSRTTWRELKDFLRIGGNVTFTGVNQDGTGVAEFESAADMEDAIKKLDGTDLDGALVELKREPEGSAGGDDKRGDDRRDDDRRDDRRPTHRDGERRRSRSRDRDRNRDDDRGRGRDERDRDSGRDNGRRDRSQSRSRSRSRSPAQRDDNRRDD